MPLDKHNSEMAMAMATGLISSPFNVILSQNVPFREPKMLQCIHHGAIFVFLIPSLCPLSFFNRIEFVVVLYHGFMEDLHVVTAMIAKVFLMLSFA